MQNWTQISVPKWNFGKTVGYKSRPSLCRQEEKNSIRLLRVYMYININIWIHIYNNLVKFMYSFWQIQQQLEKKNFNKADGLTRTREGKDQSRVRKKYFYWPL